MLAVPQLRYQTDRKSDPYMIRIFSNILDVPFTLTGGENPKKAITFAFVFAFIQCEQPPNQQLDRLIPQQRDPAASSSNFSLFGHRIVV